MTARKVGARRRLRSTSRARAIAAFSWVVLAAAHAHAASSDVELPTVTVSSEAVSGFRTPPRHSYRIAGQTLRASPESPLPDAMAAQLPGAALTHEQGNDLQPTLRFGGFAASPLLGTPQGLSVLQDGVRINEPFGDTVNWDLVPTNAIRSIALVPFADPVFGLNTLGGAVLLRTLDGRAAPGGRVGFEVGSYGRTVEHARFGSVAGDWNTFVAVRNTREDGFAPDTASSNRTLFAKAERDSRGNHLDLSYTFGQSHLAGAQTLPRAWMNTPRVVYTAPDTIDNQLNFFNLGDTQRLSPRWQLTARVYLRNSDQNGFNSNLNGSYSGSVPTLADPVANNAVDSLHQRGRGLTLAARNDTVLQGMRSVATVGIDVDRADIGFTQAQQAATLSATRTTVGIGPFNQARVDLGDRSSDQALYLTERLSATRWADLSAGGRLDDASIDLQDRLGGALGGSHHYTRFNPSVGVDLHPTHRASYYLRYAQGMRVPMPVELTCASPAAPCTLPNVLVADPNLRPVIAHTAQAGAVWRLRGMRVRLSYTHTQLDDALQFVSLANMTQGYFTNIAQELFRTARLDVLGGSAQWQWSASLSHTLATYASGFLEPSPNNSTADASGNIQVRPGDRLPNIPAWTATLSAQFRPTRRWMLRGQIEAFSQRYAQGDENNRDANGTVPGYAVVNAGAGYRVDRHWRVDLSVDNVFNRVYTDFGQLGSNAFTGPDRAFSNQPATWQAAQFVAPGAPRGVWLDASYSWL